MCKIVTNNFQLLSPIAAPTGDFCVHRRFPKFLRISQPHHSSSFAYLYALISFSFSKTASDKIRLWLMQLSFLRDRLHTCANFNRSSLRKREIGFEVLLSLLSIHRESLRLNYAVLNSYSLFSFSFSFFFPSSLSFSLSLSLHIHIIRLHDIIRLFWPYICWFQIL